MKRASAIREMAASCASTRIIAAQFERAVQIWDVESGERIAEFDTLFSFGGRRLALNASGDLCIAAGWKRGYFEGVACYESNSGRVRWHRKDLAETSALEFSNRKSNVWCMADGATVLLDALTGDTLEEIKGVDCIHDSAYSDACVLDRPKVDYVVMGQETFTIPRLTFALLDAAIGSESVCICESGGLVRCFDLSSGSEQWGYDPGKGSHVLRLWYRAADKAFYGVQWEYEKGSRRGLIKFEQTGESREVCDLSSSWTEVVSPVLDCLVTSAGSVLALSDGRLLNCLQFPECEYPEQSH